MGTDLSVVVQWWGALFLIGAAAYPLTKTLFSSWYDKGYLLTKAVGLVACSLIVWFLASVHLLPFSTMSILLAAIGVFIVGFILHQISCVGEKKTEGLRIRKQRAGTYQISFGRFAIGHIAWTIAFEELLFFGALLFWAWVKGHEPSIRGLEKFMDFGFTKSILNSVWFPPPDMWYAGGTINYYYFGHFVMAMLTKLSGLDLRYTFNLMLAALFACTFTMSFSIGYQLLWGNRGNWGYRGRWISIFGAVLTAYLVTLAGNMQTIYAFTRGYTGENVKPFWELAWPLSEFWQKLPEGLNIYWYANATRFIPFSIHEFPSYSFVVSDVHGHVLSLPFVLLAIALLLAIFAKRQETRDPLSSRSAGLQRASRGHEMVREMMNTSFSGLGITGIMIYLFYGLLVAVLFMTNALDGPIYLGLICILTFIQQSIYPPFSFCWWKEKGGRLALLSVGIPAVLPFIMNFKSFVTGVAINCPAKNLANTKVGIFLFEGVEKCQHSPFWMMWLLWGFFIYCGVWFIARNIKNKMYNVQIKRFNLSNLNIQFTQSELVLLVFFIYSVGLIIFPEFFYFKDIYPMHFRSNTMFKLGYEAFIMFSVVSGYTLIQTVVSLRRHLMHHTQRIIHILFLICLVPQLFLVSIYPIFSVRSYFDSLRRYTGLDGLTWFAEQYSDDYAAVIWMNENVSRVKYHVSGEKSMTHDTLTRDTPVIVEADGDSYTDYARVSAFTGIPTVVGWAVHEWLWRGTYDVVAPRREDVRVVYESDRADVVRQLIAKYNISYIVLGTLEREKYRALNVKKFDELGTVVFSQGNTRIYKVN
jgi:YYY domain-containing protein